MALADKYKTGVLWQDFQHGQLIELFGKIKEARENKTDQNLYRYTIAFLAMYVNHHFKLEEEYMKKYDYPDARAHTQEHKKFIQELKIFRNEKMDYSEEASEELLTRISEWVISHIMDVDQDLGKFIVKMEKKAK